MTRHTSRPARASRSWLFGATRDRVRAQWPLLIAVIAVAVLANTLITSLGLLVTATEAEGARGSLTAIPAEQTSVQIRLVNLTVPVEEADTAVASAVQTALGSSVTVTSVGTALTEFDPLFIDSTEVGIAYFGQLDEVQSHASLTAGSWATGSDSPDGSVPVTLPAAAAKLLGLALGSTLSVETPNGSVVTEVVGLYEADTEDEDYWALDPLRGRGNNPVYPTPGLNFYVPIEALGPLVVGPGVLASANIPVSSLQLSFRPDFSSVTADELGPLVQRLDSADIDVRLDTGRVAERLLYVSDVAGVVESVTSGLVVTRSTVLIVSLLLLVLAIAAMAQTARLFSDFRAGERRLMRSRGASARHILALTAVEALVIGIVATAVSPSLAALAYRLVAAQPAMAAARMPQTVDISPQAWASSAAVSVIFVVVLLAPLVGRARAIVEDDQSKARQRRSSGLMRSGLDLALVVLAGLAYWQLQSYHGALDTTASLAIDPVLAAGPALVLLAGGLLCVRLIPVASGLVERLGSRSNRAIIPLASWELGRRSQRAAAAVLLLSLALAVGTFGLSFLATWKQSQLDQAALAVGPAVRVSANAESLTEQAASLGRGVEGTPAPVFRRSGLLNLDLSGSGQGSDGMVVQVLGLPLPARELIDRGRLAELGGSKIELLLPHSSSRASGITIPASSRTLSATVRLDDETGQLQDEQGVVRAVLEDGIGLITTVDLGEVPVDALPYEVSGELPAGSGLRVVGFQTAFDGSFAEGEGPLAVEGLEILIGDLAASGTALAADTDADWFPFNADPLGGRVTAGDAPAGWQFRLHVVVPAGRQSAFSLVGWKPAPSVMSVVPESLAARFDIRPGSLIALTTQAVAVQLQVTAPVGLVPGAATAEELDAMSYGLGAGAARASTIVVDHVGLARALAQAGVAGPMVDEWWLDVPSGEGESYARTHASTDDTVSLYSTEVLGRQLQEAPLRVATQAALWVSIVAGALLAAVGFAMHSAASLRARRIELAQLRAIGLTRRGLLALVGAESLLLCVLGVVFGVSIGVLLAFLVGPLVAVSPNGTPPVPSVIIDIPATSIALLSLEMVAVLALVVLVVARVQRYTQPADLLRGGEEQ